MTRIAAWLLVGLFLFPTRLFAETGDVPMAASSWSILAGTGALGNVDENVPDLGVVPVLSAQTTDSTRFAFIQAGYLGLNQTGRYVRAQMKSSAAFLIDVRVRADNGLDYLLSYASYPRPALLTGRELRLTLSAGYPARVGVYTTYTLDLQRDLARLVPGVNLAWVRWVSLRGAMNLGRLQILDAVTYLTTDDDGDVIFGVAEDALGTNPFLFDTDGDGVADGLEAGHPCGNPLDAAVPANLDGDPDGDGVPTRTEMFLGTNCAVPSNPVLPTAYGWEPYYPSTSLPPGTSVTAGGGGELIINHVQSTATGFGVLSAPVNGRLRLPNYLHVAREVIRFEAKSAETFSVTVRVKASNGLEYRLAYISSTGAASFGGGVAYYRLASLGYAFGATTYTAVERNLSADLGAFVPGATVTEILWVGVRGRLSIKNIGFDDAAAPVVADVYVLPDPVGLGLKTTVRFRTNERLQSSPTVTVAGNPATRVWDNGIYYEYYYTTLGTEGSGPAAVVVQATDLAGHTGTGTGSVLFDFVPPAFVGPLIVSPLLAKAWQVMTVQFTASKPITTAVVTVGARGASFIAVTGDTYTYGYVVDGTEFEGAATVDVLMIDAARNTASDSQAVTFDFTDPVFTSIVASKSPAKAGDILAITFDASEALATNPSVTLSGLPAFFLALTGSTYTYTYTVAGTEIGGLLTPISVIGSDLAGNNDSGLAYTALDFDPPTFTNLFPAFPSGTTGSTVVFSFDGSETLAGVPNVVEVIPSVPFFYIGQAGSTYYFSLRVGSGPEGVYDMFVYGEDAAGNWGGSIVGTLTIDHVPPVINPSSINPLMAKKGETVTITFTLGEVLPSLPQVTVDGLAATLVTQVGNNFTYMYTLSGAEGDGVLPVRIRAWDAAGNCGERTMSLTVDAPPFVSITNPGDGAAGVTVTTRIRVQFNEPVSANTINETSFLVSGGAAMGSVSYDAPTRIAQFQLTGANTLDYDTTYTVTLTTAITDVGGNPLSAAYVFSFRTPALGMASIAGTFMVPPKWVLPRVIEVTGNHMGTISSGRYQINVDRRTDNVVYAWDDINADGAWQSGLEERLYASACGSNPGSLVWDTSNVNVSNANIGFIILRGTYTVPPSWNAGVYESETGNHAALSGGDRYELNVDRAEVRHVFVFDDSNLNGLRESEENANLHLNDPVATCDSAFMYTYDFLIIPSISGRVTEPSAPFLDRVVSSRNIGGPYSYGTLKGPMRDYTVYADLAYQYAYVWAFGDVNTNGMMDPQEVRIPLSANPVALPAGDVDGAYIFRRQISGTVPPAPTGWTHPRVTLTPDGYSRDVPLAGGAYDIWVPARSSLALSWYNDTNNNYKLDQGEAALRYQGPLNTVFGDLTGINFTGVCTITGSFTPPFSWSANYVFVRAEAVTYSTAFTGQVLGDFYGVAVQPAATQIRLLAYEDTNRDGVFDKNIDRHLGYEANDFSNVDACALTKNFVMNRSVTGTVAAPPGWVAPTVRSKSWAAVDPALNTAAVTGGSYTLRIAASTSVDAILFDDRNGNSWLDNSEPALYYPTLLNTSTANQTADFPGRTISGTAGVPIDAVNPKVSTTKVWSPVSAGSYLLNVNNNSFTVTLWDDLDDDNVVDWIGEPVYVEYGYDYGYADATTMNVVLNFNLHTIQGRVSPPPSWSRVRVAVSGQAYSVGLDGKYVAYVIEGSHLVRMFDDINGNDHFDRSEPAVSYPNLVEVAGADVLGVNIDYPTISGAVMIPPKFVNPLVGNVATLDPDGVVPVAPVAGAFSLPTHYGWQTLGVFDDTNGSGSWDSAEPLIRLPESVNVTGDISGVLISYRTVRGAAAVPPTWARPAVFALGGTLQANGVVIGSNYEVYVEARELWVGMYDYDSFDLSTSIMRPMSVDTTFGDVNNIDLSYRTIAGSVTAGTTAGWLRPRAEALGAAPLVAPLAGLDFTLYVSPWGGPYSVGAYDDFDLSGSKTNFEPGRAYHAGMGCPASAVDVSLGDVTGLIIDSACPY